MASPINPQSITVEEPDDLPAYVSNGLIGLRVLTRPLTPATTIVSGLSGRHPVAQVEAAARAPYPLAGDIQLNGAWMSDLPGHVTFKSQSYDFSCGELRTEFEFRVDGVTARIEVLTFCSRREPTIVTQQVTIRTSEPAAVTLRAAVSPDGVPGEWLRRETATPGEPKPEVDGSLLWGTLGNLSQVGIAYATELVGNAQADLVRQEWGEETPLASDYRFRTRSGRAVRLRQLSSLVPSVMHAQPDRQAVRLAARARELGWDFLRADNRAAWDELWRGRITLVGADLRWQELTDAAFFYLNSSVHAASPSSTSIFGLAQWHNYHYYYGPRDVGRGHVRRPTPLIAAAGGSKRAYRVPDAQPPGRQEQREPSWPQRLPVPVGGEHVTRGRSRAGRREGIVVRGPRHARCGHGVHLVLAHHR